MMFPQINYTSSILFNISVCGKLILPIVPLINITNIDDRYGSEVQFPTHIIDELRIVPHSDLIPNYLSLNSPFSTKKILTTSPLTNAHSHICTLN